MPAPVGIDDARPQQRGRDPKREGDELESAEHAPSLHLEVQVEGATDDPRIARCEDPIDLGPRHAEVAEGPDRRRDRSDAHCSRVAHVC